MNEYIMTAEIYLYVTLSRRKEEGWCELAFCYDYVIQVVEFVVVIGCCLSSVVLGYSTEVYEVSLSSSRMLKSPLFELTSVSDVTVDELGLGFKELHARLSANNSSGISLAINL